MFIEATSTKRAKDDTSPAAVKARKSYQVIGQLAYRRLINKARKVFIKSKKSKSINVKIKNESTG